MELRVQIDKDVCMSSGRCVLDEPEAFQFDGEQLAEPTDGVAELSESRVRAVADACPSRAIRLYAGDSEVT
jgi:ferredoxin